ncbi:hypothetical protein ACET3Z_004918 [Daucus carota]
MNELLQAAAQFCPALGEGMSGTGGGGGLPGPFGDPGSTNTTTLAGTSDEQAQAEPGTREERNAPRVRDAEIGRIVRNLGLEASIHNRILRLDNLDSPYLLDRKGVDSWADFKAELDADGPFYPLHTGRRDSTVSYPDLATYELPSPQDDLSRTTSLFASRGFDERETVSLLGILPEFKSRVFSTMDRLTFDLSRKELKIAALERN